MLAFLLSAVLAFAPAHGPKLEGRWQLGHGYTAVVYQLRDRLSTNRFEIVRKGRVIRSWHPDGTQGFSVLTADITGDGVKDTLFYSDIGGSGGCGEYRLYGGPGVRKLWGFSGCADSAGVALGATGLDTWHAVFGSKTKASSGSTHCCWRRWVHREWRWKDGRLQVVAREITRHRGPWHEGPVRGKR
jgi:hypothetical protein